MSKNYASLNFFNVTNILNLITDHLSHFAKATKQLRVKADILLQKLNRDFILFISMYKFCLSLSISYQKQFSLHPNHSYCLFYIFVFYIYRERTLWYKMGKAHEFGHICDLESMLNSSLVMGFFSERQM